MALEHGDHFAMRTSYLRALGIHLRFARSSKGIEDGIGFGYFAVNKLLMTRRATYDPAIHTLKLGVETTRN